MTCALKRPKLVPYVELLPVVSLTVDGLEFSTGFGGPKQSLIFPTWAQPDLEERFPGRVREHRAAL